MRNRILAAIASKTGFLNSKAATAIRAYFSGDIPDAVRNLIYEIANNDIIAETVAVNTKNRRRNMRRAFMRLSITSLLVAEVPIQGLRIIGQGDYLEGRQLVGDLSNWLAIWEFAMTMFIVRYFSWRRTHHLGYIASQLVAAIQAGMEFCEDPMSSHLRDQYASIVQATAKRYRISFKYVSNSTSFFASQVRATARACRDDILSMVPSIVRATPDDIRAMNGDLARLIIRSQTGYWHQTADLRRAQAPMRGRDRIRVAITGTLSDRAIQTALIGVIAAMVTVLLTFGVGFIKK